MDRKIFYIHTGNNGARYIINLSSIEDISTSLEFYKPLNLKRRILKKGFFLYMCLLRALRRFIPCRRIQNCSGIQELLSAKINNTLDYNIDMYSSIFTSSSNDKIIVNHQGKFYEKFSFGDSYKKSCNEIKNYSILQPINTKHYVISELRDINDYGNYCSFKLYNKFNQTRSSRVSNKTLVCALVELFQATPMRTERISDICAKIRNNYADASTEIRGIAERALSTIESAARNASIWVGFVHGDFKIWNIQPYTNAIHIYDFEESKLEGFPLEDLYNYYIDPMIMTGESDTNISNFVDGAFLDEQSANYLKSLGIQTNRYLLLLLYLLNRLSFYRRNGSEHIVQRYLEVLSYVLSNSNKLEHINS